MLIPQVIDFVPGCRDIAGDDPDRSGASQQMLPLLAAAIRTIASSSIATACLAWSARLIAKILARQLQVPEALVRETGRYVYVQIDSFERRLLLSLLSCPAKAGRAVTTTASACFPRLRSTGSPGQAGR